MSAVIAQTDIVQVISADIDLKRAGAEYSACCPFHNEKTPSFTVSPAKQFYHCFGCSAHGDAIQWMRDYHGMGYREAVKALGGEVEPSSRGKAARRAAEASRRERWRWFAGEVFGLYVDVEAGLSAGASVWDEWLLFDLGRLREKVLRRARGEALALTPRERGVVNYFCNRRHDLRDRVLGMYGVGI